MKTDTQRHIFCLIRTISGQQLFRLLRRNPCTGLCKIKRTFPPATEGKTVIMHFSVRISPLQRKFISLFPQNPQGIHCQFIQRNLREMFRHTTPVRKRGYTLRIGFIRHRKFHMAAAHHLIRHKTDRRILYGAFYSRILRDIPRLLRSQTGADNMTRRTIGIPESRQISFLH